MRYVEGIRFTAPDRKDWPFALPLFHNLSELTLPSPITILVGENGSGKSTLLEALAIALALPAIGRADAHRDETLSELRPFARSLKLINNLTRPKTKFFLRSEDFFGFIQRVNLEARELKEELKRVKEENAHRSAFAQGQAAMAYAGSLAALEDRYGEDLLSSASHGESFLRLFQSRMVPQGLYLLDEPEAPLSPLRQLALLSIIRELSEKRGCQFILATHSPILMALPNATLFNCDQSPLTPIKYNDLESVSLLKNFLDCPERMIRQL